MPVPVFTKGKLKNSDILQTSESFHTRKLLSWILGTSSAPYWRSMYMDESHATRLCFTPHHTPSRQGRFRMKHTWDRCSIITIATGASTLVAYPSRYVGLQDKPIEQRYVGIQKKGRQGTCSWRQINLCLDSTARQRHFTNQASSQSSEGGT